MEIDKVLTTNTVNSNSYNELFMNSLSDNSTSFLKGKVPKRKLFVFIETSGILDVIRLVVRRSISKTTERLFPFPNLAQVLILIVTNYLKESYEIVEESSAELKVHLETILSCCSI